MSVLYNSLVTITISYELCYFLGIIMNSIILKRFLLTHSSPSYKPLYLPSQDYRPVSCYRDIIYSTSSKSYIPFIETIRNYVFSEDLSEVFNNPDKITTRFNLLYLLSSVAIYRIQTERPYIARQIKFNLKLYNRHSAVFNFYEEFNSRVYKEMNRSYNHIHTGVSSWILDSNTDRLKFILTNEVYELEPHPNTNQLIEYLNRIYTSLQEAKVKNVLSNPLIWIS